MGVSEGGFKKGVGFEGFWPTHTTAPRTSTTRRKNQGEGRRGEQGEGGDGGKGNKNKRGEAKQGEEEGEPRGQGGGGIIPRGRGISAVPAAEEPGEAAIRGRSEAGARRRLRGEPGVLIPENSAKLCGSGAGFRVLATPCVMLLRWGFASVLFWSNPVRILLASVRSAALGSEQEVNLRFS